MDGEVREEENREIISSYAIFYSGDSFIGLLQDEASGQCGEFEKLKMKISSFQAYNN